jgi:poly-gamma-glutamate capsule biosynthesis protein CapA/YwtB (metallophosphatase superfamily)
MPPGPQHRRRQPRSVYLVRRAAAAAIGVALIVGVVLVVQDLAQSSNHNPTTSATTTTPRTSRHGTRGVHKSVTTTTVSNPVTIAAVGDTELGNTPNLPSSPSTYLQPVAAALSAPIVFGNLEGTLTDQSSSKCAPGATNCYAFHTPPSYAQVLRQAGFTVLNSANNHSHDFGSAGLSDTSAALVAAGITQTGLPGQIGVVTQGATKVAFAAFAPYSNTNNLLDLTAAKQLIAQARAEATVVVVYMHAGAEGSSADHVTGQDETYVGEDRGNEKAFAHAAIDDGADLVIASGPHVLRGMEFYNGHLIAYSLGDFATYQDFSTSGDLDLSGILKVTLRPDGGFASGQFISLLLDAEGRPAVDSSGSAAQFVNQLSTADFGSAAAIISTSGQISPAPGSG